MRDAETLEALQCPGCQELTAPPRLVCPACGRRELRPVALSGRGTLYSYTTIRVPPARFKGRGPYRVAVIELAEGIRLTGRLEGDPGDEIALGTPVRFDHVGEEGIVFRVASGR
jgi:uncharacterized OB-fold protein